MSDEDRLSADITPEQFRAYEQAFRTWRVWFGNWAAVLVLLSFAGYGLAFWIWYGGDNLSAIVVASAFYLLFRFHRRLLFKLAERKFGADEAFEAPLRLLERLRIARGEHGALTELAALIAEADGARAGGAPTGGRCVKTDRS